MPDCLKQIIRGDKKATYKFYRKYSPKILNYLIKRLPTAYDAQDIMQDVFFEAIDSLPLLRNETKALSWLYKIAHNKVVDYYRKKRIKTILLSQIPYLQLVDKEVHEPEFIFEKNKVRDKIEKVFSLLSWRHQKILRLHYERGMKLKEIANTFHLSLKATESLLFRARRRFIFIYERT